MCVITIPGKPIAWKRAGRQGNIYYDQQIGIKNITKWHMRRKWHKPPSKALIELGCDFIFPFNTSFSKAKRKAMMEALTPCCKNVDLDNCLKFVLDAGQGILWLNDNQVVSFSKCGKYWGEEGSTIITFREI